MCYIQVVLHLEMGTMPLLLYGCIYYVAMQALHVLYYNSGKKHYLPFLILFLIFNSEYQVF